MNHDVKQATVAFIGGLSYKGGLNTHGFCGPGKFTDAQGFEFSGVFEDGLLAGQTRVYLKPVRATAVLDFKKGRLDS